MSRVLGRASRWEEVELSRLLKQDEMALQGGSLYCRSALHSIGMEGIVLAAVLGDSKASIDDTLWRPQLVPVGRSALCTIHCRWNPYADSEAGTLSREIVEENVMKGQRLGRAHPGGEC
jgi:hypothetical protein